MPGGPYKNMIEAFPLLQATYAHCSCPVCLDVFKDPICFPCGHVLCRACAARCIAARPRCPMCNQAVAHMRHGVSLPQLSLFCTVSREVGLRYSGMRLSSSPASATKRGASPAKTSPSTVKRPRSVSRGDPEKEEKALRGECGGTVVEEQPQQPLSCTSSPERPLSSPTTTPSPSSLATPLHLVPCHTAAEYEDLSRDLTELCHDAMAAETQRLPCGSPASSSFHALPPSRDDALERGSPTRRLGGGALLPEVEGGAQVRRPSVSQGEVLQERTSPPPSPADTSLQWLRAHLMAVADEWESTPCLNSRTPSTPPSSSLPEAGAVRCEEANTHSPNISASGAHSFPSASGAMAGPSEELSLWWDQPKSNKGGVLHCTLIPPAARLRELQGSNAEERAGMVECCGAGPSPWSVTSASSLSSATAATDVHRVGQCVLCDFDVTQHHLVRERLERLLRSPAAHCDPAELGAQTEKDLALLLGPLWGVCCCEEDWPGSRPESTAAIERGTYAVGRPHEGASSISAPTRRRYSGVAHHNCLAWVGLLDRFTDTSSAGRHTAAAQATMSIPDTSTVLHMTVPIPDLAAWRVAHVSGRIGRWQLLAATLRWKYQNGMLRTETGDASPSMSNQRWLCLPQCTLCEAVPSAISSAVTFPFGAGVRACEGVLRGRGDCDRWFHYPCAILAGASACLVLGLEDARNVVAESGDRCVGEATADALGGGAGMPVEVWCGACHARHETDRRRRKT